MRSSQWAAAWSAGERREGEDVHSHIVRAMSFTQAAAAVATVWIVIGVLTGVVMGRRGHNAFGWLILGAVLGPLVLPIAVNRAAGGPVVSARTLMPGEAGTGPVDVLVGVDGSGESIAALRNSLQLLGDRVGRLTVAAVVDRDAALRTSGEAERNARAILDEAAREVDRQPEAVVLFGRPSEELVSHARTGGFDLIVVGKRGRGMSKAILGSVTADLAKRTDIPVLIVGEEYPATDQ